MMQNYESVGSEISMIVVLCQIYASTFNFENIRKNNNSNFRVKEKESWKNHYSIVI